MIIYIKIFFTTLIILIFTACSNTATPHLLSVSSASNYQINKTENKDYFSINDIKIYLTTKWEKGKFQDNYEYKIFMPDGRIYQYESFTQKDNFKNFSLSFPFYIKNLFPELLEGKWYLEVYANKKLLAKKEFFIGDKNKQYDSTIPNIKIAILPFEQNKQNSTWKHQELLSKYLKWSLLYHHKNIEIIHKQSKYKNANYIISGKISSKWNKNTQDTHILTKIQNNKTKEIINTTNTNHSLAWFEFIKTKKKGTTQLDNQKLKIYKKVYTNISKQINNLNIN